MFDIVPQFINSQKLITSVYGVKLTLTFDHMPRVCCFVFILNTVDLEPFGKKNHTKLLSEIRTKIYNAKIE